MTCRLYRCRKASIRMDGVYYVRNEVYGHIHFSLQECLEGARTCFQRYFHMHPAVAAKVHIILKTKQKHL